MLRELNRDKALIFRIEHIDNLSWEFANRALECRNSRNLNPSYVNIGNAELIGRRSARKVPIAPGGTLSDYVPFYFTPSSVMMLNIVTGFNVPQHEKAQIVVLVSSIPRLRDLGIGFVFTNRHAYSIEAEFFSDPKDLDKIDWKILQNRDFKTTDDDPDKQSRYQAEALVHATVPLTAILGLMCFDKRAKARIESMMKAAGINLPVHVRPGLFF